MSKENKPETQRSRLEELLTSEKPSYANLGIPECIRTIPSLYISQEDRVVRNREFWRFPEVTIYPSSLVEAFKIILTNYSTAFDKLVKLRQERINPNCYNPAKLDGNYFNFGFQIDLKGLPPDFLDEIRRGNYSPEQIAESLRYFIFEIENSLAMYGLMRGIFSSTDSNYSPLSFFGVNFDAAVRKWEEYHKQPLFLGTVTPEKFQAMLLSEFGTTQVDNLTPDKIRLLSGFSGFLGPEELEQRIKDESIEDFMLYMRTSYPVSWLKNPQMGISIPLLEDPETLEAVRKRAVTFNVDNQNEVELFMKFLQQQEQHERQYVFHYSNMDGVFFELPGGSIYLPSFLNDTKEALVLMGLVLPVGNLESICQELEFKDERGKKRIGYEFNSNLGISPEDEIRVKPLWFHYGGYGHVRGRITDGDVRGEIRRNLKKRGPYVLQKEIPPTIIINKNNAKQYEIIHRLFFTFDPQDGRFKFIGGLLNALPSDTEETKRGRIHGNKQAVWGEIVCGDEGLVVDPQSLNFIKK